MKNIVEKAELIQKQFTTSTRDDGTKYVHLKGMAEVDYPQWMQDVMFAGHLDKMPDDLYYKAIENIIDAICDCELEPEYANDAIMIIDCLRESSYLEPDVYTSNLTAWLNEYNDHVYYLTQALEEYGMTDGFQALTVAQSIWLEDIANAVLEALDNAEVEEEEEVN